MKKLADFKYDVGDIVNCTKTTYEIVGRRVDKTSQGRIKKYLCQCQKCHGMVEHEEKDIRNCIYCANKKVLTGFNDINTTHPELVKYFENPEDAKTVYAKASRVYVNLRCPTCGFKRKMHASALTSSGKMHCPRCSSSNSYPNKLGLAVLLQLPIENLETEFSPSWAGNYRYDFSFYHQNIHYLMEMDGSFHYDKSKFKPLEEIQEIDRAKNRLASENNCTLIRIECKKSNIEYIRKNMESSLIGEIFDLATVDWIKCERECSKNSIKQIADYYNKTNSIEQTADHFYMCEQTAITYLKRAATLGWCNYQTLYQVQNKNMLKAVEIKKANPELSRSEVAKLIGVTCTTATSYLEKAKQMGLIDNIDDSFNVRKSKIMQILKDNPNTPILQLQNKYGYAHGTLRKYKRELDESASD